MKKVKSSFYRNGSKLYKGNCDYCSKYYEGRGEFYCSGKCRALGQWKDGTFKGLTGRLREKAPGWKGGKSFRNGYVFLYTDSKKYIGEHRLVMEKYLGRKLTEFEEIHHKNGIKDDNRLKNLQLVVKKFHYGKVQCPKCHYKFLVK